MAAVHFITLTTRSGKILVNPHHIKALQDLGDAAAGEARTNVLAGHTLFVFESVQEILDACAHVTTEKSDEAPATESGSAERKRAKPIRAGYTAAEKLNIKAARALEELAAARGPIGVGAKGKGSAGSGPDSDQ
jgi:hypothetical protein